MKKTFQRKERKPLQKAHDWKKRQAEIKAELDRIDREFALNLKTETVHPKHD
jgi:hypothetical protein